MTQTYSRRGGAPSVAALVSAVEGLARSGDPARTAQQLLDAVLAALPQADGGAVLLMHPQTGLFWTGAVTNLPTPSCQPFFETELGEAPDTFRRMAATRSSARGLRRSGPPDNPILVDVLEPHDFHDDLRCVFLDAGVAWGGLSLWRRTGEFTADDESLLDTIAARAGSTLHDSVLASVAPAARHTGGGGLLVVEAGRVVEADVDDPSLRRELAEPGFERYRHIDHLLSLAAADQRFSTILRTEAGGWLTAHGRALSEDRTAIILGSATPADLLGARVAQAGLSAREIEVTRLLCRGLSDAEIAATLFVSPHTVHDHVRSVRRKLGVRSRAAVAALIFAEAYFDRFLDTARIRHD